jgi:PTH1 family peptidyl-tRNA hydrolase
MKLIVGLGNPGEKFKYTRHNIGFMVVEKLVKEKLSLLPSLKAWKKEEKFLSEICRIQNEVIIIKPQTYMNLSGLAVSKIANFYKITPDDIWVVHDDIDLPIGKIRIRKGGASAGHHGIESMIKELGMSEFIRFRLGIGEGKLNRQHTADHNLRRQDVEKFVVSLFKESEAGEVKKIIKNATEALSIALDKGVDKAMNRFN